ncbi:MAG: hypothetical protein WDM81_17405 [Rhizomicrobium sp.]
MKNLSHSESLRSSWYFAPRLFGTKQPGTALGDWAADSGLGYDGGALVFGAVLAVVCRAILLDPHQPHPSVLGRLHPDAAAGRDDRRLSRQACGKWWIELQPTPASAVLAAVIVVLVLLLPQRAGEHPRAALNVR